MSNVTRIGSAAPDTDKRRYSDLLRLFADRIDNGDVKAMSCIFVQGSESHFHMVSTMLDGSVDSDATTMLAGCQLVLDDLTRYVRRYVMGIVSGFD